jgi:hypothetical protein
MLAGENGERAEYQDESGDEGEDAVAVR